MRDNQSSFLTIKRELECLKPWLLASRPKTLPICLIPVLVGTALAFGRVERIDWTLSTLVFLCSLCLQVGTNYINDALDYKKGADTAERVGFLRVTQAGLLSFQQVLKGGFFFFACALLMGIPLILAGGWPFLFILIIASACGYLYTGGPMPLAYHGLAEPFIFIFYGLVSTSAVYYLQTKSVDIDCLLAATQLGLLAIVPCAINNLRDIQSDAKINKRTLAVRFGATFGRLEIAFLLLAPFAMGGLWALKGKLLLALLPLAALPIAYRTVQSIWTTEPSAKYNEFFVGSVMSMVAFGLALTAACLFS
ncbi:1,4-dihydroxy-2-naphthoate octaprenyltransferase [Candidatus Protochlamydia phocaeensis]|uniref:1,4-dihydroxy-2-naphthoate octaprenyltransferase n=1 Tax=Candidatus Protochlamydia phocaeensis TaxID=1414722 RepID=UPI000838C57F|nr:1,4-dihydroxy-2-naphthoate octaprenyltransferase [Candidatus Protochlamydia phocaeensis]